VRPKVMGIASLKPSYRLAVTRDGRVVRRIIAQVLS
jgi:hypothetical protein